MSIPAVIGLANVLLALLYGAGYPFWAAADIHPRSRNDRSVSTNGFASHYLQLNPLVVTLATGSIVLRSDLGGHPWRGGRLVPDWLVDAVSVIGTTGPIPLPGAVMIWLVIAPSIILSRASDGARPLDLRRRRQSARRTLAGVPMLAVWMAVYALSAALAAITGMLLAGFSGAADPTVGAAYLFTTVAAVVVGGTPLTGGRGGYLAPSPAASSSPS